MALTFAELDAVVSAVALLVVALALAGWLRRSLHRPARAAGDPQLAALVDELRSPATRRLAVAVVDLGADSDPVRSAFIDCGPATGFEVGSVTKGLTGLLIADAVARGEVALDRPISAYVPVLTDAPAGSVTLLELGTHRSGLPRLPRGPGFALRAAATFVVGTDPYRGLTPARVVAATRRSRLRSRGEPRYSNLGAALAGQVIAQVTGTAYAEVLAQRILRPLGMHDTTAHPSGSAARGWRAWGRRSSRWRIDGYAPAGGVVSTSADLTALAVALLEGRAPGGSALGVDPDGGPSLFWMVDRTRGPGRTMVWHNGQTGGYSAFLALRPQARRAVVALSDRAAADDLGRLVRQLERRGTG